MTEKEMNAFADIVANKVVKTIESKQQEWDIEFQADLQHFVSDSTASVNKLDVDQTPLIDEIEYLKDSLSKALEEEDYNKAIIIDDKIKKLKDKLK
jgi:excinuclease UvrABC helicase subunit UvrB|tara:strand:+ start:492 stop:779 length:288 start_codon:yes stop_codon:yes gene_type:complete